MASTSALLPAHQTQALPLMGTVAKNTLYTGANLSFFFRSSLGCVHAPLVNHPLTSLAGFTSAFAAPIGIFGAYMSCKAAKVSLFVKDFKGVFLSLSGAFANATLGAAGLILGSSRIVTTIAQIKDALPTSSLGKAALLLGAIGNSAFAAFFFIAGVTCSVSLAHGLSFSSKLKNQGSDGEKLAFLQKRVSSDKGFAKISRLVSGSLAEEIKNATPQEAKNLVERVTKRLCFNNKLTALYVAVCFIGAAVFAASIFFTSPFMTGALIFTALLFLAADGLALKQGIADGGVGRADKTLLKLGSALAITVLAASILAVAFLGVSPISLVIVGLVVGSTLAMNQYALNKVNNKYELLINDN